MRMQKKIVISVAVLVGMIMTIAIGIHLVNLFNYTSALPVKYPSEQKIESYGRDKFVTQVLEFKTAGKADSELLQAFKPIRIEDYGEGVLLVFAENEKYIKGLYIDPKEHFDNITGSGVAIIHRSKYIGIAEIKKREVGSIDLKGLGVSNEINSTDLDENDDPLESEQR